MMTMDAAPTIRQYRLAADLINDRDWSALPAHWQGRVREIKADVTQFLTELDNGVTSNGPFSDFGPLTLAQMRRFLDTMMALPRVTAATAITVPAGRYAVENAAGELRFYMVSTPTEGKWAGMTFVKVLAGDDTHNVRGPAAKTIINQIAANPEYASRRYGQEIGSCGVCGRTLTDAASRAAGIGPVCQAKMDW